MQLIKKGEKRGGGKGDQKKGKNLSQDTIYLVKALYEDNDFFRKCLKKSVSRNIHKQKRLILLNLNELLLTSNSNMSVLALGFQNFVNCVQYVFLMDHLVFIQCVFVHFIKT